MPLPDAPNLYAQRGFVLRTGRASRLITLLRLARVVRRRSDRHVRADRRNAVAPTDAASVVGRFERARDADAASTSRWASMKATTPRSAVEPPPGRDTRRHCLGCHSRAAALGLRARARAAAAAHPSSSPTACRYIARFAAPTSAASPGCSPSSPAINLIAAHCESYASCCASTSCTARSFTSAETCSVVPWLPLSREKEPPTKRGGSPRAHGRAQHLLVNFVKCTTR